MQARSCELWQFLQYACLCMCHSNAFLPNWKKTPIQNLYNVARKDSIFNRAISCNAHHKRHIPSFIILILKCLDTLKSWHNNAGWATARRYSWQILKRKTNLIERKPFVDKYNHFWYFHWIELVENNSIVMSVKPIKQMKD